MLIGMGGQADEVADVAVATGGIVDGTTDVFTLSQRQLLHLPVQILFAQILDLVLHLFPMAIDELDPVVIVGIVAGGDHDAAVEIVDASHIGHTGRGGHVQHICVRAGGSDARDQSMLQHIAGPAGILADDDAGLVVAAVIPADEPTDLIGMLDGQYLVDLAAKTVCSEIFTHVYLLTAAWPLRSPCRRSHPDGAAAQRRAPSR